MRPKSGSTNIIYRFDYWRTYTHTFLPKPTLVTNRREKTTLVNQVGCYGINLGRIDFFFEDEKLVKNKSVSIEV